MLIPVEFKVLRAIPTDIDLFELPIILAETGPVHSMQQSERRQNARMLQALIDEFGVAQVRNVLAEAKRRADGNY